MAKTTKKPRVAVIGTGGTISSLGRNSLDLVEYPDFGGSKLEAAELLARVPEIAEIADAIPVRFRAMGSIKVTPKDWLELNELIHKLVAEKDAPDGIVITHGTATLEETAYFLNLSLKVAIPVVIVGAQRPANGISSDAAINLLNAIRVAGSPEARGLGVLVVLNDEIQAGREVTKTSVFRLQTFQAHDVGMLGYADSDGTIAIYRTPARKHAPDTEFDVRGLQDMPRVDIVYSYAGSDATATRAFVAAGARGIVVASLAPGLLTPGEKEAVAEARGRGVQVVLSCRAGSGRIVERQLQKAQGIIPADNLNPQKARVLLMLALTRTDDPERIGEMFRTY
ncbi:MAG: asparaginase [Rhodospirillales bacterium]|nr:asparaginase [Rhodospirillales bacterium]